jgi:hypothetical protein
VEFPSGRKPLVSEYVGGNQGMMCFITQRYARDLASGGMLGYVFDGDITKARTSVFAAIQKNRKKLKCTKSLPLAVSTIMLGSNISETIHRLAHSDFIIYHIFVAVP